MNNKNRLAKTNLKKCSRKNEEEQVLTQAPPEVPQ